MVIALIAVLLVVLLLVFFGLSKPRSKDATASASTTGDSIQQGNQEPPKGSKQKWVIVGLGTICLALIISLLVHQSHYVGLQNELRAMSDKIEDLELANSALWDDKLDLKDKYEALNTEAKPFLSLTQSEKQQVLEAAKSQVGISQLEGKAQSLQGQIDSLNEQLAILQGNVVKASGDPVQYPAGYLYAGKDFKTGRYKISNGSSNFIVRSSAGKLKVNEILGSHGLSEYIYTFADGDEVEAGSPFTLTPID